MKFSLKVKSRAKNENAFIEQKDVASKDDHAETAGADANPASPPRKHLSSLATHEHLDKNPSPVKSYLPRTLSPKSVDNSLFSSEPGRGDRAMRKERRRRSGSKQSRQRTRAAAAAVDTSALPPLVTDEEDTNATTDAIAAVNSSEGRHRRPGAIVTVTAPPGKLGLVIDSHPTHGMPVVFSVLDNSIIHGRIRPGDRLTMVNRTDLTVLKPTDVAKELHETRGGTRRLRLFRPDVAEKEILDFHESFQKTYRSGYQ